MKIADRVVVLRLATSRPAGMSAREVCGDMCLPIAAAEAALADAAAAGLLARTRRSPAVYRVTREGYREWRRLNGRGDGAMALASALGYGIPA